MLTTPLSLLATTTRFRTLLYIGPTSSSFVNISLETIMIIYMVFRFLSNGNISWKEQAKLGLDLFPSLTHELPLASVCAGINEPLTNITSKFTGCLDYIWSVRNYLNIICVSHVALTCRSSNRYDYTRLRLTSLLGKLEASKYSTDVALPNSMQPSDHIPLFASFTISPQ